MSAARPALAAGYTAPPRHSSVQPAGWPVLPAQLPSHTIPTVHYAPPVVRRLSHPLIVSPRRSAARPALAAGHTAPPCHSPVPPAGWPVLPPASPAARPVPAAGHTASSRHSSIPPACHTTPAVGCATPLSCLAAVRSCCPGRRPSTSSTSRLARYSSRPGCQSHRLTWPLVCPARLSYHPGRWPCRSVIWPGRRPSVPPRPQTVPHRLVPHRPSLVRPWLPVTPPGGTTATAGRGGVLPSSRSARPRRRR